MTDVDDVHEQVGVVQLLERRAEGRDERRRQLVDEADRVRHEQGTAAGERHAPRRRIERGERLVRDEHGRAGERVQQRRLSDVRVADQRGEEETVAAA